MINGEQDCEELDGKFHYNSMVRVFFGYKVLADKNVLTFLSLSKDKSIHSKAAHLLATNTAHAFLDCHLDSGQLRSVHCEGALQGDAKRGLLRLLRSGRLRMVGPSKVDLLLAQPVQRRGEQQ